MLLKELLAFIPHPVSLIPSPASLRQQRVDPFLPFTEICACYGSDMTDYALNHRFRRIRTQAVIIKEARSQGLDLKELSVDENVLPDKQGAVDKKSTMALDG